MTNETVQSGRRVIAVFDFDGTLTRRDTSLPFVLFVLGRLKGWWRIIRLAPLFLVDLGTAVRDERLRADGRRRNESLGSVLGRWETNVHERVLRHCFVGMRVEQLRAAGQRFIEHFARTHINLAGLRRLDWHKQQGHRCVLISASIDVYLDQWAADVGFDDVLGTRLDVDSDGIVTGRFLSEACWGRAKVRRLEAHLGSLGDYTLYAYGDGRGDADLLAIADHGFLVTGDFEFTQ